MIVEWIEIMNWLDQTSFSVSYEIINYAFACLEIRSIKPNQVCLAFLPHSAIHFLN